MTAGAGPPEGEAIRVLLADDHRFFRDGVRLLLDATPGLAVVGEASTGEEAVALAEALQPDVVLMDLNMPALDGIEATRRIVVTSPHIRVLILTMYEDEASVFAALRAGARGYLLKGADADEVLRATRGAANGEAIFGPAVAGQLLGYFATPRPPAAWNAFPGLTEREREVLACLARGASNAEIAQQLYLSPKTVRNHVSNIFGKLQIADRTEAIIRARDAGLGDP